MKVLTVEKGFPEPAADVQEKLPFVLTQNDGTRVFAETATGLVATFIDKYDEIDTNTDDGVRTALARRIDAAEEYAGLLQKMYLMEAVSEHPEYLDALEDSEDDLTAVQTDKNQAPYGVREYGGLVPLVLNRFLFEPITTTPLIVPKGDATIYYLNPDTDLTLLETLADAGVFGFKVHE